MRRKLNLRVRRHAEPTQLEIVREVMLAAAECGTWLTLDELARLTHYPQTSISAQLRHLRKPANGSFLVEKRRRESEEVVLRDPRSAVWEYQLWRGMRRLVFSAPRTGGLRRPDGAVAETAQAVL
ncbi:MAG: hypothetical protein PVS2B2_02360 [Candidatus Acidiferrum sp.]